MCVCVCVCEIIILYPISNKIIKRICAPILLTYLKIDYGS